MKMKAISAKVTEDLHRQVRIACALTGQTISSFFLEALQTALLASRAEVPVLPAPDPIPTP